MRGLMAEQQSRTNDMISERWECAQEVPWPIQSARVEEELTSKV